MLLLASTSDKLQLITDAAGTVKVHASWVDLLAGTPTGSRTNTAAISTAATTDIVGVPAASTIRNVKFVSVRNTHASQAQNLTLQHTDGSTVEELWKGALAAGEALWMVDSVPFVFDISGAPKLAVGKLNAKVRAPNDVINATTSFADITGLTVPLQSGKKYNFEAHLYHVNNATTTGSQFAVNIGAAPTVLQIANLQVVTPSVTAAAVSGGQATARDTAATADTTGATSTRLAILSGYIQPSADGTLAIRGASEVAVAAGLTVKAGSWLWVWETDN